MSATVWIFHGEGAKFSSAVFTRRELAEQWIAKNGFSGMLTEYPLDVSVYDLHTQSGFFIAQKDVQRSREFMQNFTSASQEHYHYVGGR